MQPLQVSQARVERAQEVFLKKASELMAPELAILMTLNELGYYDQARYGPEGELEFDLTDLQWVAVAAAFAAVHETGGYIVEYPQGKWRISLSRVPDGA